MTFRLKRYVVHKRRPWKHQLDALMAMDDKPSFALLMEQRTGKTKPLLENAVALHRADKLDLIFIVAPSGVHSDWLTTHWEADVPDEITSIRHVWRDGKTKREQKKLKEFVAALKRNSNPGLLAFSISWDQLITDRAKKFVKELLTCDAGGPWMIVADEIHRMKSPKAQRTKQMFKLADSFDFLRGLTGTIIADNPLDVWAPFHWLNPKILNCPNWFVFRNTYAHLRERYIHGRRFLDIDPAKGEGGYQRLDELKTKIAAYSYAITAAECLDLPPRVYEQVPVELSAEQRSLYDDLAQEALAEFDGHTMTAPLAITALTRFSQLLGGFFVPDVEEGEKPVPIPLRENPRLTVLLEHLKDFDEKAIIWLRFRAERAAVEEALVKQHGEDAIRVISEKKHADEFIEDFKTDPAVRFLVANPEGTASEGRDLSVASTMIYFSNSYKLTARLQSEARCDKKGKTGGPVRVIDLVAKDTVDENVVGALRSKRDVASKFSGEELRRWLKLHA